MEWHYTDKDVGWTGTMLSWMLGGMAPLRRECWVTRREMSARPCLALLEHHIGGKDVG